MNIESIMLTNIQTASMDHTLAEVKELLDESGLQHIMVVDEDYTLLGVISDRDIMASISPNIGTINEKDKDRETLKKKAHQIMTRNPVTISKGASVPAAAHRILTTPGSCLPVVDSNNRAIGFVSWKEVMAKLIDITISQSA
jgi:acetoin utilization protein AcuB